MTTLILTEKPSVARDFAKALGAKTRNDGYIEGDNTLITWAVGHLVELLSPEDYSPEYKRWKLETLPILPENFRYKPIKKSAKQLGVIKKLLKRKDISKIVVATDAGREGEVIARTILLEAGCTDKTRILRFWTSQALTPQVVKKTMADLKPLTHYDRLWRAGYYRQVSDWMVGMNGTRALTVQLGDLYSVGRVQTAVLALLVQRRREREHFKPEPYVVIKVLFENTKGQWLGTWFGKKEKGENASRIFDLEKAKKLTRKLEAEEEPGSVLSATQEKVTEPPPYLFSLTDLQQEANKRFGFPAKKTLAIAQGLYQDKKCLSYPRTDSRVLGSQNVSMIKKLIETLSAASPELFKKLDQAKVSLSNKRVFNDAKLTDHHALIPLKKCPSSATADEAKIFDLVLRRFAAAFHPHCHAQKTKVITGFSDETFLTQGKTILSAGWRDVWPVKEKKEEAHIPPLEANDPAIKKRVAQEEKATTPPPEYTDALILKEMTNPGRYVSEKKMKDLFRGEVGIGTQSTRAQILEILIQREYVQRERKNLVATDKGCFLVESLQKTAITQALTSPEETARWEMSLNSIALGEPQKESFLETIKSFVSASISELKNLEFEKNGALPPKKEAEVVGRCPACGGEVTEAFKNYRCACGFAIWKKMAGKTLSPGMAAHLLRNKKAGPYQGFKSKKGKRFSAGILLEETDGKWQVHFDFHNSKEKKEANPTKAPWTQELEKRKEKKGSPDIQTKKENLFEVIQTLTCPACGGQIIEGKKGFGCANWRRETGGCTFVIWKEVFGRTLTPTQLSNLLQGKPTRPCQITTQNGDKIKTRLRITATPQGFQIMTDPDETGRHLTPPIFCSHKFG
ncbi:MAG: DNA topoisomerase 3 [Desulfobacterales bacterium]|nr:DNA topoisomerase 3 [Desulfobacterales bacterium]